MAGNRGYDPRRFENLVLYFASKSGDDPGYGKVKLNKLLFRADFEPYRLLGASIKGEEYKAQEMGPVAAHLPSLIKRGVVTIEEIPTGPYNREAPFPTEGRKPDMSVFSPDETEIMKRTLTELLPYGGRSVSHWSHEVSVGWRTKSAKRLGSIIPYSSAPLSIRPLSPKADQALRHRFQTA
jgi:hypothetical protein